MIELLLLDLVCIIIVVVVAIVIFITKTVLMIKYVNNLANLNDRSQIGDHDSEIAAIIEDKEFIDADFPGGKVGIFLIRH